jgi:PIN domain nuclease of toxin-antitoxin system
MIVVDTHILIWDALDKKKLKPKVIQAINIADETHKLLISDISLWEVSMLIDRKRIEIQGDPLVFLDALTKFRNFTIVPIDPVIAVKSVELNQVIKSDPADSLIAATAYVNDAKLITADQKIIDSGVVETLWK